MKKMKAIHHIGNTYTPAFYDSVAQDNNIVHIPNIILTKILDNKGSCLKKAS